MHAVVSTHPRLERVGDPAEERFLHGKGSRNVRRDRTDRESSPLLTRTRNRRHDYHSFHARGALMARCPDFLESPDSGEDDEPWEDELEGA